jgi:hypothetical protein
MSEGISPYDVTTIAAKYGAETSPFPFSYPPIIAYLFLKASWIFSSFTGQAVFLLFLATCSLAIPLLQMGWPFQYCQRNIWWVFGLYLTLFGFGGTKVFASGNIAGILAVAEIVGIVVAIRFQTYRLFWIATFFCSYIKLYFLSFLLFPVILDKRYTSVIVFCFIFGLAYFVNYFIFPQLFSQFVEGVALISRDPNAIGRSLYTLVYRAVLFIQPDATFKATEVALSFQAALCIFVALLARAVFARFQRPGHFEALSCWLFLSAFLISPRWVDYDIPLLVIPCILLGRMLASKNSLGFRVAAIVAVLGTALMRTAFTDWSGIFFILGIWFGSAVHFLNRPSSDLDGKQVLSEELAPIGV